MNCVTDAWSLIGSVFGMQATAVNPPATADARAGRDRLLVLLPGLAQVHVHVDESGRHDQRGRHLDDVRAVGGQIAADTRDAIALDQDVKRAVAARHGIHDARSFQQ